MEERFTLHKSNAYFIGIISISTRTHSRSAKQKLKKLHSNEICASPAQKTGAAPARQESSSCYVPCGPFGVPRQRQRQVIGEIGTEYIKSNVAPKPCKRPAKQPENCTRLSLRQGGGVVYACVCVCMWGFFLSYNRRLLRCLLWTFVAKGAQGQTGPERIS